MNTQLLVAAGILLIIVGILVLTAGLLLGSLKQDSSDTRIQGGGVVFIGPIPIIFGTDRNSAIIVIVLALILTAAAYLLSHRI